jgi:hypothetical protein
MELMPAHVTRGYTLLVFGTATVVGVPLLVWRSQADESVSEAAQIFALTAVMALLVVGIWSVWRTRRELRRAQAMPDDATVHGGGVWWRVLFIGLGVCGGVAPFGRDGFNDGDSTFAAFGYGARLPKILMLYVKNLMFLDGAIARLAPDLDILAEIASISMWFAQRHGERLSKELGIDPRSVEFDLEGVKAGFGLDAEVDRLTYRELQARRQLIQKRMRSAR